MATRRITTLIASIGLSCIALTGLAQDKPNIILIMADDLGYGDVGFNGNTTIKTPSLDAMAKEGAVMTNFHAGGPVCSPTRGTFLTGRHYYRYGIFSANQGHLPKQEVTIAEVLKDNGYVTGHFGKWHLGTLSKAFSAKGKKRMPAKNYSPPIWHGYDSSFVTESAVSTWDPADGHRAKNNPFWENGVALDPTKDNNLKGGASKVVMDRVIPFIQKATNNSQPFFAVVWFHAPHAPVVAGPKYLEMYKGHGDAAHYYGVVTEMDEQIGRLRAELNKLGVSNNTLITFTSDNGPERAKVKHAFGQTGGLRERKRSLYEGGVRVPALALWPGHIKPGSIFDQTTSTLDYFPTIQQLVGYKMPDERPIDGVSLLGLFEGKVFKRNKALPFRFKDSLTLIEDNKKYVTSLDSSSKNELYNLASDRAETNNLAHQHKAKIESMRRQLEAFTQSTKKSHAGHDYNDPTFSPVNQYPE